MPFHQKKIFLIVSVLIAFVIPSLLVIAFVTEVKTLSETNVTKHEATLNGQIKATGNTPVLGRFRYTKTTTASCINMQNEINTPDQVLTNNGGVYLYNQNISGLESNTTYYYCAIGTQDGVSQFGNVVMFTTKADNSNNPGNISPVIELGTSSKPRSINLQKQFAGIISSVKAREIQALEAANFACAVPGTSIEIRPKGIKGIQPTSFLIPPGTISKTKNTPRAGQKIVGKYSGKTTVTCIFQGIPPVEETVQLDTITMYGNSAR
ncbi:MAG: hypothetical protein ACK4FA_01125 [Candidatus Paceibacteria bacterium]